MAEHSAGNGLKFILMLCLSLGFVLFLGCEKEQDKITVTDIDGNVFEAVTIGTQIWMKENLKTTKFNDGTPIPLVTDPIAWRELSTPGYCWYDNDELSNKNTYGALYNWYTVNTSKLCPTGWHVPTDSEWTIMEDYIGGREIAGGKLKEAGTVHWAIPNEGATNESGFSALPGGKRSTAGGLFGSLGYHGCWWTPSTYGDEHGIFRYISYKSNSVDRLFVFKGSGHSVRCIKD